MNALYSFILLALVVFLSSNTFGQAEKNIAIKIDEYFSKLAEQNWFNGSVLIAQNGKIILRKAYNIQQISPTGKISVKGKFIIASVSKLLIKASILKLAESKKLSLDNTLNRFIPGFPDGNRITINNLLEHTSGLPRELTAYKDYESLKLEKIVELAKVEKLEFEPSSRYLYSNIGYYLLQFIISKIESYPKFTVEKILKPTKMISTNEYNFSKPTKSFALGFLDDDIGNLKKIDEASISRTETGNYYSTVDDLFAFVKSPITKKMLNDKGILEHAGGREGYRAWLHHNSKTGLTFIFLSNYSNIPFDAIVKDIPKIIYQESYEIPQRKFKIVVEIKTEILRKYVGIYELEADKKQKFSVAVENGKLVITDAGNIKTHFFPESETVFFSNPKSSDSIEFVPNQDGKFDLVFSDGGNRFIAKRLDLNKKKEL